jgi:cytochrome c oxidase subunit 3
MSDKSTVLWHHFDDLAQQHEANTLGMWAFLATEVLVFGALFTGYTAYRFFYDGAFEEASSHLNVLIAAINTVVLLTSSLTMALSVWAAQAGARRMLVLCLLLTALLGTAFMVLKAVEYVDDYHKQLVPGLAFDADRWEYNPAHVQLFLAFYYIMTGLHAVHLTFGIAVVAFLAVMARRGAYTPAYHAPVEMWGLYWHFVDIVWIFLLPLLYLIGRHSLADLHF